MTAKTRDQLDYDVTIAGGGMAGATLALALARQSPQLRIGVVEPFAAATGGETPLASYQPSYDARATAMSWGTRQCYERIGIWEALAPKATPIKRIHVSEQQRFGSSRLDASEHEQPALGYVLDNAWTGLNLQAALQAEAAIDWFCPASVAAVETTGKCAKLTLDGSGVPFGGNKTTLTTGLLVVADGGRSRLRESLGFQVERHAYEQAALIANVSAARSHQFEAFERFTCSGPIALLPQGHPAHSEGRCGLVWTMPPQEAERMRSLDKASFLAALQQAFGWRLGRFVDVGQRFCYPLVLERVQQPLRPHVVLVGNAAHTLHPVAGQGFNLAIRGLMRLAGEVTRAFDAGHCPGDLAVLERYWTGQQEDVNGLVAASGALVSLFSGTQPSPIEVGRNLGLVALELVPPARRWFTRQAMGLGRGSSVESVQ